MASVPDIQRLLQISDLSDGVFLRLPAILDALRPEAERLHWQVLDLDAFGPPETHFDFTELGDRVAASASGVAVQFADLLELAE